MAKPRLIRRAKGTRSDSRLGTTASAVMVGNLESLSAQPGRFPWAKLPALLVLVGSIWVLSALFTNPRFRVSEVVVQGARVVRSEEVRRAVQALNGNIFRLNTDELAASLVREFGCIERASVQCQLPDKVVVRVQEHAPVLVWESGGRTWWVDERGTILGSATESNGSVVVHDIKAFNADPQGQIAGVPWKLVQELAEALPENKSLDYSSEAGLILYVTAARWPVYLGHKGNAQLKVTLLRSLANQLLATRADVEYIDLRNEQRPIYKKRG